MLQSARQRRRVRGHRHRHRHRARKAAADLRGVPAGRRRHQPQVRRHRPRPGDQPRAGDAARRRDPPGQQARAGQHVHALSAAAPTPARRADDARPRGGVRRGAGRPPLPVLAVAKAEEAVPDDRDEHREGDSVLLIVEDDPHYARILLGLARDKGFKGIVANRGAAGARAGARIPAHGDHARRLPARHARLDGAQQPQARSARRATSRCRCCRSRRSGSTACRTARSRTWSSRRPPASSRRRSIASRLYVAPHTKRLLVIEDNDVERESIVELLGARRHRDRRPSAPAPRRWRRCASEPSTAASSTCGCPT